MADGTAPAQGAGGDVGTLLVETDKNLSMIAEAAQSGSLPEDAAAAFAQAAELFRSAVEMATAALEGGAAPKASPRSAAEGTAAQEAGGNPNARPMSMGG